MRTILIVVLAAAAVALGVPPAAPAGSRATPRAAAVRQAPADEALEYVSLGRAVDHAARQQRQRARLAASAIAERDDASPWRAAAIAEGIALAALAVVASVLVLRGRRRPRLGV